MLGVALAGPVTVRTTRVTGRVLGLAPVALTPELPPVPLLPHPVRTPSEVDDPVGVAPVASLPGLTMSAT
ncbi:hypothetical protein SAMN05444320_11945 [Streptoalloteichus hindustanus]|uniref:Uncharacterized protein n=1 Tax=Streptoalloteichus hindustanus TaxID=2017 RepID=A0A1M5PR18_STRHI|nr:hypothetical protein SAMN05444320_11945 [Streptoalloteichus hindustanus]